MKEASGELSMTAIAVVAIAAIGVLFTTLIWPGIKANLMRSTNCAQVISCENDTDNDGMVSCKYCKTEACTGNDIGTVQCPVE